MRASRAVAAILIAGLAAFAAEPVGGRWETLIRAPIPEDSVPKISVVSIPVPPAPPVPRAPGPGHTHAGPVFAYILQGEIENQVEPDPPAIYNPGGFFYEMPGRVHRFLRNRSTTEPARLIIFQEGDTGKPAPVIKILLQEPLASTVNQEVSLLRLTLPPGSFSKAQAHSGPDIVYILEGTVETSGATAPPKTHGPGDLFLEPARPAELTFRNAGSSGPARLLLYQVSAK